MILITVDPQTNKVRVHRPVEPETNESLIPKIPGSFLYSGPTYQFNKWNPETNTVEEDKHSKYEVELTTWKEQRDEAVQNIVVTTSKGFQLQGDELAQTRMSRAVLGLSDTGTIGWVDVNNNIVEMTRQDLGEALYLAGATQSHLWVTGRPTPPEEGI